MYITCTQDTPYKYMYYLCIVLVYNLQVLPFFSLPLLSPPLVCSENNKVSHYIVSRRGQLYLIGDQTFTDLPSVIEFYRKHFLDTATLREHVSHS